MDGKKEPDGRKELSAGKELDGGRKEFDDGKKAGKGKKACGGGGACGCKKFGGENKFGGWKVIVCGRMGCDCLAELIGMPLLNLSCQISVNDEYMLYKRWRIHRSFLEML